MSAAACGAPWRLPAGEAGGASCKGSRVKRYAVGVAAALGEPDVFLLDACFSHP